MNFHIQQRVANWVEKTFGASILHNKEERALRFVEEALEVGQSLGLDAEKVGKLVARVYSRPVGGVKQELGGAGVTLLAVAHSVGLSLEHAVSTEISRIEALPADYFRKRSKEKAESGVGHPSSIE